MKKIDPQAVRRLALQLRGLAVSEERAAQLAVEIACVNAAARAAGGSNDFNDQPTGYAVALAALAKR